MRPILFDFQTDTLNRYAAKSATGLRNGIIQLCTGGGKTYIAAEQANRCLAKGRRCGFVAKNRRLVEQYSEALDLFGVRHGVVMDGHRDVPAMMKACSRDTLYSMMDSGAALPEFDLLQIDECHNEFGRILDYYRLAWKTGYTATPCKGDGRGLGAPWQFIEVAVPMLELIRRGRLVPVKVYNPEAVGQERLRGTKGKVAGNPVAAWFQYACGVPTAVFCPNRLVAHAVLDEYTKAGVSGAYLDAESSKEERDAILGTKDRPGKLQTGEVKVVVSVGILSEGVDVPCLGCAQILRGCGSFVLWRQILGRPMRCYGNKTHAIILDHSGAAFEFGLPEVEVEWSVDEALDNSASARKKAREERTVACPRCGTVFSKAPECPSCHWVIPKAKANQLRLLAEQADALLTEFQGNAQQCHPIWQKMWNSCLFITANKGGNLKMAAGMFSGQAKRPPWEARVEPLPGFHQWALPVAVVFPQFVRRKVHA